MTFELVVLGSSGTHVGPGRVCSGFLLRTATTQVVIDCGNGSLSNLFLHTDLTDVDALIISHRHPDHCIDLISAYYALRFHPDGPAHLDVHAPSGTADFLAQLVPESADDFREVCRFSDVAAGDRLDVGDITFEFFQSVHVVPTVAVRATNEGRTLVYSSDSAGGEELEEAARDADLFVCEATWTGDPDDWPGGLHLTARGAAELGRRAGVRQLALTHIAPYVDRDRSRVEAEEAFGGEVILIDDGDVLDVAAMADG